MARQKGMLNLSGNIEVNAGAPFDARDIVPTKADLTVASNFPYAYVGMETYVVAEDKKYRYMGGGVETLSNWAEVGSGGGTTYNDFVGATDLANGVHGLVPAPLIADKDKFLKGDGSWAKIAIPDVDLSNEISGYNIYSTTEKIIGQWIDGKPLYQKVIPVSGNFSGLDQEVVRLTGLDIDTVVSLFGTTRRYGAADSFVMTLSFSAPNSTYCSTFYIGKVSGSDDYSIMYATGTNNILRDPVFILRYTKTTDTVMDIGSANEYSTTEKIVGTWIDGKPIYQIIINTDTSWSPTASGITIPAITSLNIDVPVLIRGFSIDTPSASWTRGVIEALYLVKDSGVFKVVNYATPAPKFNKLLIQYTKATD